MDATAHPEGYPELGLAPRSIVLRPRAGSNLRRLGDRVEQWETSRGNAGFRAVHLDRLTAPVAFELANVLVSLREWFPRIRVDHIDFAGANSEQILAEATVYPVMFHLLRGAALEGVAADEIDDADCDPDLAIELEMLRDEAIGTGVESAGSIDLSRFITSVRGQRAMVQFWQHRNEVRARNRRPQRIPDIVTSPATFVLVHEFGHLLDGELCATGWEAGESVYRTLSEVVLGVEDPSPSQWRYHLINYPGGDAHSGGPGQGGPARARQTRKALSGRIADVLGSYAPVSRDELFAEAFALAHCGPPDLRRRLRPFLVALSDAGLRRRRR